MLVIQWLDSVILVILWCVSPALVISVDPENGTEDPKINVGLEGAPYHARTMNWPQYMTHVLFHYDHAHVGVGLQNVEWKTQQSFANKLQ